MKNASNLRILPEQFQPLRQAKLKVSKTRTKQGKPQNKDLIILIFKILYSGR